MAMADFTPNHLSVNTAGLMREIESAIDICLDELSYMFQELLIRQMRENGNGSSIMKDEAVTHVKEISRKYKGGTVELEVGVDENISDERARIRTLVVIYGNIEKDTGTLWTKPGEQTWRKDVAYRDESKAKTAYPLYRFIQFDVHGKLLENCLKEIEKYGNDFIDALRQALDTIDFSDFIIVG